MIKVIYLCFVVFAFIITSCYEQTVLDNVDNDNQSDTLYDNVDDVIDNDNQSDSQNGSADNNNHQSEPSYDDELNNNSNNNVKARNKSGSRIIFNEYHLSDGSVIYDSIPFDSSYDRYCTFIVDSNRLYSGLEGCCVSFQSVSEVITAYKDSNCTDEVSLLKTTGKVNIGDITWFSVYPDNTELYNACGRESKIIYAQIVTPINHIVYTNDGNNCVTWAEYATQHPSQKCYNLVGYKELTIDEARSFFVCVE